VTQIERASSTRSKRGRWSKAELTRLREIYGLRDNEAIARELRRPLDSVHRMARTLFPGRAREGPWTATEVLDLKRYLGATTPEVIARILGRSVEEVRSQIFDLGRIRREEPWIRGSGAQAHLRHAGPTTTSRASSPGASRRCPPLAQGTGLRTKASCEEARGEHAVSSLGTRARPAAELRRTLELEIARMPGGR
jgi:hypothetical protein